MEQPKPFQSIQVDDFKSQPKKYLKPQEYIIKRSNYQLDSDENSNLQKEVSSSKNDVSFLPPIANTEKVRNDFFLKRFSSQNKKEVDKKFIQKDSYFDNSFLSKPIDKNKKMKTN